MAAKQQRPAWLVQLHPKMLTGEADLKGTRRRQNRVIEIRPVLRICAGRGLHA
jgi:hypothetical protein